MAVAVRRDEAITVREVDGELLILDMRSSQVHQFNQTASFIWSGCSQGLEQGAIVAALVREFETDETTALRDVEDTLTKFGVLGLLDVNDSVR